MHSIIISDRLPGAKETTPAWSLVSKTLHYSEEEKQKQANKQTINFVSFMKEA